MKKLPKYMLFTDYYGDIRSMGTNSKKKAYAAAEKGIGQGLVSVGVYVLEATANNKPPRKRKRGAK